MRNLRQLPKRWRMAVLRDVAEIVMGQSPPGITVFDCCGEKDPEAGLPFIQGNAEFGNIYPEPSKWCTEPLKVAESGDLLISVRAPVGDTNRAHKRMAIGRGLAAIRFTKADARFGWHFVNHAKDELGRVAQGSTFRAVGRTDLIGLPFALPPVSEQKAVAAVLDAIDEAIERTWTVIRATDRMRDVLLHELLTRGVPGCHTKWRTVPGIGKIPYAWGVTSLGHGSTFVGSGRTPRGGKSAYTSTGVKLLRSQNVHFDGLRLRDVVFIDQDTDNYMRRSRVYPGDVLLNITGASIGRCTVAPLELGPANVNQHVCIIRMSEAFNPAYVSEWLGTSRSQKEIDDSQIGQSRQGLNYQQVRALNIAQPSRAEQDHIARIIERVRDSARAETDYLELLRSLKASTTEVLLTGKLNPRTSFSMKKAHGRNSEFDGR